MNSEDSAVVGPSSDAPAAERDTKTGQFLRGNQAAHRNGVRAFEDRGNVALPVELREQVTAFREALEADQGGTGELTTLGAGYVRRLAEIEALCGLLGADLMTRGFFTERGHVRSTFNAFLLAVDRWDRLAQRIGVGRKAKHVNPIDRVRQAVEEANRK